MLLQVIQLDVQPGILLDDQLTLLLNGDERGVQDPVLLCQSENLSGLIRCKAGLLSGGWEERLRYDSLLLDDGWLGERHKRHWRSKAKSCHSAFQNWIDVQMLDSLHSLHPLNAHSLHAASV